MARFETTNWTGFGQPRWAGDFRTRDHLVPGPVKVDAAAFPAYESVRVTVAAGGAAAGATSIPVAALSGPIPNGTILDFTGAGEYAKLTAAAAEGATALTVEALDAAIEAGDTATYAGTGRKYIPSGTVVGRTFAEAEANTPFGPAAAADDDIAILAFPIEDADEDNDGVLYRPGSVVKENLLPEVVAGTLSAGVLAEVRARYYCQRGVS